MTATMNKLGWKIRKWNAPHLRNGEMLEAWFAQLDSGYLYVIGHHESKRDMWTLEIEGQTFEGSVEQLLTVAECHATAKQA